MTDTLISFETAKLAKEKGFNEPIRLCYSDQDRVNALPYDAGNRDHINSQHAYYSVPTQSLLQKWLREVHQLLILINIDTISSEFTYSIWRISPDEEFELLKEDSNYNLIYEDALEQALIEALKLINNDNTTKG